MLKLEEKQRLNAIITGDEKTDLKGNGSISFTGVTHKGVQYGLGISTIGMPACCGAKILSGWPGKNGSTSAQNRAGFILACHSLYTGLLVATTNEQQDETLLVEAGFIADPAFVNPNTAHRVKLWSLNLHPLG